MRLQYALITFVVVTLLGRAETGLAQDYQVDEVASGLSYPWSIAFLPDGNALLAQLSGELLVLSADGELSAPITGVPEVYFAGQGGLFDVVLDPEFADNSMIYLSFAAGDTDANGTEVIRAQFEAETLSLTGVETLFRASPQKYAPLHYGGRLAWLSQTQLLLTTGDGFDFR